MQTVVLIAALLLPYVLFAVGNTFRSLVITVVRAAVAIAAGWCLLQVYVVRGNEITVSLASPSQLLELYDKDGAALAFAAVLGWIPGALIVLSTWLIHTLLRRRRPTHQSNQVP